MFVRLDKNLPEDPSYPADLTALGYKVNENGEFVKISSPNEHFTFFISDNERVNEVHKEAMHIAAREMVAKELAQLGVKEIYLTGKDGAIVEEVKPEEKHLGLFATDLDLLGMKGEVVVIVGEHNQDPGIFAYRVLTRDEGMDKGSAVGLVKRLQNIGFGNATNISDAVEIDSNFSTTSTEIDSVLAMSTLGSDNTDTAPGIIILNPGQLLYSHAEKKSMTWATWSARKRPNAISKPFQVHPEHNRIPGHTTAEEHIATVFNKVIPQLVNRGARISVIGITDGSEGFVKWLDDAFKTDDEETVAYQIKAMAFMEPTHNPKTICSDITKDMLKYDARSYIKSPSPLGKWINGPDAMKDIRSEDEIEQDRIDAEVRAARTQARRDAALLEAEESHAGAQPVVVARAGNSFREGPVAGEEAVEVPSNIDINEDIPWDDEGVEMRALGQSILEFKAREASEASSSPPRPAPSSPNATTTGGVVTADDAISERDDQEEVGGSWEEGYDYGTAVSCPTFSSGVADYDELILPAVAEGVVEWFSWRAGKGE